MTSGRNEPPDTETSGALAVVGASKQGDLLHEIIRRNWYIFYAIYLVGFTSKSFFSSVRVMPLPPDPRASLV